MAKTKTKKISLVLHAKHLEKLFPNCKVTTYKNNWLKWEGKIKPTPLSKEYSIGLSFVRNIGIRVSVLHPKPLELAEGKETLPHVYSTADQLLCLFKPKFNEWDIDKLISKTIIPWVSEWLMHYEIWLITGTWHGGGIHPPKKVK